MESLKTNEGKNFLKRIRALSDLWLCTDIVEQNDSLNALGFSLTLLAIAAAFAVLELSQPLYFNQDDNFSQFFPMILSSCRQMFHGHFPSWNPYQFLGTPAAGMGLYALTYPVTYLSYAIATYLLRHEYWTLEVFALIHLMAGSAVTYLVGRRLGLRPFLALAATLSFQLSGFSLIAGRSWYYVMPVNFWMPLLMLGILDLERLLSAGKPIPTRWIVGMGVSIGVFFHSGNAQFWVYSLGFFSAGCLAIILRHGPRPASFLALGAAIALGITIAMPLAVPQWIETSAAPRDFAHGGNGVLPGLLSFLIPSPLVISPHPELWGSNEVKWMGQFYYSGTLFPLVALLSIPLALAATSKSRVLRQNIWLCFGIVAFILCIGKYGLLWQIHRQLPVFKKFILPFKFLGHTNFFLALGGGIILERIYRSSSRSRLIEGLTLIPFFMLIGYHVCVARPAFYLFTTVNYPPLPGDLQQKLEGTRIVTIEPIRSTSPSYYAALPHNLPSVYGVYALSGYDTFSMWDPTYLAVTQRLNANQKEGFRELGVSWILIHDTVYQPVLSENEYGRRMETFYPAPRDELLSTLGEHSEDVGGVRVWKILNPRPLVFLENSPEAPVPYLITGSGISVSVPPQAQETDVILNFTAREEMRARLNGQTVPLRPDPWMRVRVHVPANEAGFIEVEYQSKWVWGMLAGIPFGLLSLFLAFVARSKEH